MEDTRSAVFVSSGYGNALLLIPLLKTLKKRGHQLTGVFTSPFESEPFFENSGLFEELVPVRNGSLAALFAISRYLEFEYIYLDRLAATRKNILLAHFIGKFIITAHVPHTLPGFLKRKLFLVPPQEGLHDAQQILGLVDAENARKPLNLEDMRLPRLFNTKKTASLSKPYIAVQLSAGSGAASFKNWPTEHWISLLKELALVFPSLHFVLLGESGELDAAETVMQANIPNVQSEVGKTSLHELVSILDECLLFIGPDSALMHLAAVSAKPTFTLWGATDFSVFGYATIDPAMHEVVYQDIACRPCSVWIKPNVSRFKNAESCPDHRCMKELPLAAVLPRCIAFIEKQISNTLRHVQ